MIKNNTFLLYVNQIATENPAYLKGHDGSDGFCDCIGLIKGALRRAGEQPSGLSGTNYAARKTIALEKLTSEKQLTRGCVVLKSKEPGEKGYSLPETYHKGGKKYNGDLRDYYHIGVVTGTNPLQITHMTEPSIKVVKSIDGWKWYGNLSQIEPENNGEKKTGTMTTITKVNFRIGPSVKAAKIATVGECQEVELLPEPDEWKRVKYNGKTGYIMSKYLEKR